ncbi:hypothetical protein PFICI_14847 [Pestalotiopsis fici W106-1]|uniref:Uncharacterized protein n=1 Tax=Pestalotiopsis fici (strain W106-1 / CGMCC3.15140) TaxID=1229662 RepID=W3WJD9_PESFW|nr:uncharacterized protein PFICI_14847 [Pestalotiopsis fici W106-1]ETS73242.1 hypothetical protein PFICI_14847 [Pestalotiopsis fici W106-1]
MDELEKQRRELEAIAAKLEEGRLLLDAAVKSVQDGQARSTDLPKYQEEARKLCQEKANHTQALSSRLEAWKKELQYIKEGTQALQEVAENDGNWFRIRWEAYQIQEEIYHKALLVTTSRTTLPAELPEYIKRLVPMNVREEMTTPLKKMIERRDKTIERLEAEARDADNQHERAIERLEAEAEDVDNQHERAIERLKSQHEKEVEDLESRHEKEVEDLNTQLRHAESRTVAAKADRESTISLYNAEQTIIQEKGQIIKSLKENINTLKEEIASQKATIEDRDLIIKTKDKYINTLKEKIATQKATIKDGVVTLTTKDTSINTLKEEIASQKATIQDRDVTITTKDKYINSLKEKIATQKATIKDGDVTITTKDKFINTLKTTIDSKKDVIRAKNAEIQEKVELIDSLEKEVQSSQGAVNAHKKTIGFLRGRISSSKRVTKLKGRTIESLRKTIKSRKLLLDARKKKISLVAARLSSVKASRAATMTSLGDLQGRYDARQAELAILQGYNTNLLRNIARLSERRENLEEVWVSANGLLQAMENLGQIRTETIKSLRGQVESNQALMANKDRAIASLETEKTTANNSIDALNHTSAEKTETITSLTANVASRDQDKKRLEEDMKALESSHANAVEQLKSEQAQAMQKLSGKAEQDLLEKARQVEGLKTELSQKEAELSGKQSELSGKQTELFRKETELSRKQAELSGKQTELSGTQRELSGTQAELFRKEAELQSSKQSLDKADETVNSLRQKVTDLTANARKGADLARVNSGRIQDLEAQKVILTEGLAVSFATEFKSSADVASWVPFVNSLAKHTCGNAQPLAGEKPWVILPPWTSDDPVGEKPAPSSVTSLCGQLFSGLLKTEFNNCHIHLLGMLTKSLAEEASPPVNLVILVLEKCLAESEQRHVTQHTFDHFYLIPLWQVATVLSDRWPDHPTQSLCDKVRDLVSSCYCAPVYDAIKNGCDAMASQLVGLEEPSRQSMFLPTLGMGFMGFGGQLREGILVVCPRDRSLRLVTSSQCVWEGDVYRMRAPQGEQDILLEPKTSAEYFWIFANTDQKYV